MSSFTAHYFKEFRMPHYSFHAVAQFCCSNSHFFISTLDVIAIFRSNQNKKFDEANNRNSKMIGSGDRIESGTTDHNMEA